MTYCNVALIAPDSQLDYTEAEVRALSQALRPVALRNGVTVQHVVDLLTSQPWDVIWFACHGAREGVLLTDGLLSTSTLIQLCKQAGAGLVVLNTCESEQVGAWIYMQTNAAVICTVAETDDRVAYVTGTLLAKALAQGLDIETAYNRSRPGEVAQAQVYRLFARAYTPGQEIAKWMELLSLALAPTNESIGQVHARLGGMEQQIQSIGRNALISSPGRRTAWIVGATLYALPLVLFDVLRLLGVQLHWVPYVLAVALTMALAVGLLLYGMGMIRA